MLIDSLIQSFNTQLIKNKNKKMYINHEQLAHTNNIDKIDLSFDYNTYLILGV